MKHLVSVFLSLSCLLGYAQQGALKGNINTENFPEVSFVWNEYNPDTLSANQFAVKENGKDVAFTCENISIDSIPQKNKTILFLWEYQYPPKQKAFFDFIPALLKGFIDRMVDTTSTFNVRIFNNEQGPIVGNFTSDKNSITKFIETWSDKAQREFKDNSDKSSLLSSIKDGLVLISKEPKENTRAIVVITKGQFTDTEMLPIVKQLSLQNKIPIYVVYFPAQSQGDNKQLVQLAEETCGRFVSATVPDSAQAVLLQWFNDINFRHYGHDYKITFSSLSERDGSLCQVVVNDNLPFIYNAPNFSLWVWAKAHPVLSLILLVVVIAAITLGTIFGIKFFKKRMAIVNRKKQEAERLKARQLAEQENLKRKLNATQEELQRQQKSSEREKQQAIEQEQEERLAKLMRTKNLQPRLIVANDGVTFNISHVTTTMGREADNIVVLSDGTVSKHHAQIVFDGDCFGIYDLQSSNGVIVNGKYVESAALKSADIIQLGEVIIKFYL